jgi:hypothetical protein
MYFVGLNHGIFTFTSCEIVSKMRKESAAPYRALKKESQIKVSPSNGVSLNMLPPPNPVIKTKIIDTHSFHRGVLEIISLSC